MGGYRMGLRTAAVSLAMAASFVAGTASAQRTYDVVGDFGKSHFNYGSTNKSTGCFGVTLTCFAADPNGVPTVAQNVSGTSQSFQTVTVPNNTLLLHPGAAAGQDSSVTFTPVVSSLYTIVGAFSRLDNTTSGDPANGGAANNGVIASVFLNTVVGSTITSSVSLFSVALDSFTKGATTFSLTQAIGLNQTLSFVVNNNGNYVYDSTGLTAVITAVPEVATWAMMMLGLGMIGGTMRYRRKQTRVTFA